MRVKLLKFTEEPELAVAQAARLCYYKSDISSLQDEMSLSKARKLIKKVVSMGHTSVLEHAVFTFGIEDVSRVLSHQLVRHRIASFSQQSQRYVEYDNIEYYIPEKIARNEAALSKYKKHLQSVQELYRYYVEAGIPAEDARYILPNAVTTKIITTFNARSLLNFFLLRSCTRAQSEIRVMAREMLKLVKDVAPSIFKNAGPSCVSDGKCQEGKKGCGHPFYKEHDGKEISAN
ncbi:FAD-dependent thymidylate synthase [bacterium]|nr:FAD-dependent thymidylate synthase [bacterium]